MMPKNRELKWKSENVQNFICYARIHKYGTIRKRLGFLKTRVESVLIK